jgi:hypothetical protein
MIVGDKRLPNTQTLQNWTDGWRQSFTCARAARRGAIHQRYAMAALGQGDRGGRSGRSTTQNYDIPIGYGWAGNCRSSS